MNSEEARSALKHEIALGYRVFAKLGWGDLGDGHISGRDPDRMDCFWLLDANTAFIDATPEKLVLIDSDGCVVEGEGTANKPAYYIHWPILNARPELISVAHTHTPAGTPVFRRSQNIRFDHSRSVFFRR